MNSVPKNLPKTAGVYLFKKGRNILYVGKAAILQNRVRSYFDKDLIAGRGPSIVKMVKAADSVETIKTGSVLEALLLEAALIKRLKPKFNVKEKDDRSFYVITISKEDYPKIELVRARKILLPKEVKKFRFVAGPFPSATELKIALKIIRKIFPFRTKCRPNSGRMCLDAQMGLCPGVCAGMISSEKYISEIKRLEMFLSGKKKDLLTKLKLEMGVLAKEHKFEEADFIRKKMFALSHIQDISLIKTDRPAQNNLRIEAYDISHLGGEEMVGAMAVVSDGEFMKGESRLFKIKSVQGQNDVACLKEIIYRRMGHPEWPMPKLIVVDGGFPQKRGVEKVLEAIGVAIPVVAVLKDQYHRPKTILGLEKKEKNWSDGHILLANQKSHQVAVSFNMKRIRRKRI
ncbi:MAG: hypothetical protein WC797_04215 [Candidatus Paceibacterota bacterium]|jgi:excinuclease ABC subunit C